MAVLGAGAVGGYFGARAAASGMDVTFIARGEHLEAMREHGLRIKSIHGDLHIRSAFISPADQIAPVDLVVLAVKSQDTEEAARSMGPFIASHTAILSLQNGWTTRTGSRACGAGTGRWQASRSSPPGCLPLGS